MVDHEDTEIERLRRELSARPDKLNLRIALAKLLDASGDRDEALITLREGTFLSAGRPDHLQVLGEGLASLNALPEAIEMLLTASRLAPEQGEIYASLALIWAKLGEKSRAEAATTKARQSGVDLALDKINDGPTLELTRHLFDQYADRFEHHLLEQLNYRVPQELGKFLTENFLGKGTVIDLGCGTGLMGQYLRPLSDKLIGGRFVAPHAR